MIDPDLYRQIASVAHKRWPRQASWLVVFGVPIVVAIMLILPDALLEIVPDEEKPLAAGMLIIIAAAILVPIFIGIDASLKPIVIPKKPFIYVFFPVNDVHTRGDMLLQYAGFLAAKNRFDDEISIHFRDSSAPDWILEMEKCIETTPLDSPIWLVITMSKQGQVAREKLNIMLNKDQRLRERLTALFTVTSSRFETRDRQNMFRLFVDGEAEAIAISEHLRLNYLETTESKNTKKVLCFHIDSPYGIEVSETIKDRLSDLATVDRCTPDNLQDITLSEYQLIVVIAYDQDLRLIFNALRSINFAGTVIGTTTLSVPDWQQLIQCDQTHFEIAHTAVSGFERNQQFIDHLEPITIEHLAQLQEGGLLTARMMNELHKDREMFEAYQDIQNNYISAFCYDCICLFDLASKKGHPTLRSLLDDPRVDEERRNATVIRDLDFGVTGDSHVSVFIKKINSRRSQI